MLGEGDLLAQLAELLDDGFELVEVADFQREQALLAALVSLPYPAIVQDDQWRRLFPLYQLPRN